MGHILRLRKRYAKFQFANIKNRFSRYDNNNITIQGQHSRGIRIKLQDEIFNIRNGRNRQKRLHIDWIFYADASIFTTVHHCSAALRRWGQRRRRLLIRMLETSPFSGEWHKNFCGRRSAIGRSRLIVDRLFRPRTVFEPRLLSSRWLLSLRRMHLCRATTGWGVYESWTKRAKRIICRHFVCLIDDTWNVSINKLYSKFVVVVKNLLFCQ